MNKVKTVQEKKIMHKTLVGEVLSVKTPNTVIVVIKKERRHALYGKVIRTTKHMAVHFDKEAPRVGQTVRIVSTRPMSKTKFFRLDAILT